MKNEVQVLFTMDVELVSAGANSSGPETNEEGAERVREYMEVLEDYGYKPTFFIHPELGETQSKMFLELREQGACLGLHIHAAKFAPTRHKVELGALSFAQQKEVLTIGLEMFERYFGFKPDIFRPGCFSSNDYTYRVLNELGFKGGSICIPGRVWMDRYCVWAGADFHPHYANENMRQIPGDSSFVEIPLSVDASCLVRHPLGFDHYFDLRPGDVYSNANVIARDHQQVLANIVQQLNNDKPALKTIVIDVHNDRDFKNLSTIPAQQLKTVLDNLKPELAKYGMTPVGATYDQAIKKFREGNRACRK
jgi:peptidoglycan/xylan/chitin deacetylase (PgdA/CDA1 family)